MRDRGPGASAPFPVAAVVDETRALLAHRLRAAGCAVEWSESMPGVQLVGDPARLGQVLVNLVSNAIDAYEDVARQGAIAIHAERDDRGVRITVRDQAGGMPEAVASRAFEELFTTKEPGRGTGLGLWIGRNLVEEAFHGTLTLETTMGEGTCFTITVPHQAAEAPVPPADSVVAAVA